MMRVPEGREFGWWALKLTLLCVAVFALSQAFPGPFYGSLTLVSSQALSRPWTLVTHIFMHADLPHLYFNMFALAVFGSIFERHVGSRTFLITFFAGGLAATAADIIFYPSTLGASGAIFAVLGGLAAYRPRQVVWAVGVPMYVIVAFAVWAAIDLAGLFQPDGIAHASHLAGSAYGGLYGLYLRRHVPGREGPGERPPPEGEEGSGEGLPSEEDLERWEEEWMKG